MTDTQMDDPPEVPNGISRKSMQDLPFSLVLTDNTQAENPIVYVNDAFCRVTGFSREASVGRNCRFLQGEGTDEGDRRILRDAIAEGQETTVDIVNYRADGTQFVNRLLITPLQDDDGVITHYLGIQNERPEEVTESSRAKRLDEALREVQHRVKNHLSMLLALIRMEARQSEDTAGALGVLANRVESLNLLYSDFARNDGSDRGGKIALGAYLSRVCSALNLLDGLREVRLDISMEDMDAPLNEASQIGLLLSELLTNSLQHAFDEDDRGSVEVRLYDDGADCLCLEVKDDGRGLPEDSNWPHEGNLGSRIVRDLVKRLNGEINVDTGPSGTSVIISIPMDGIRPPD